MYFDLSIKHFYIALKPPLFMNKNLLLVFSSVILIVFLSTISQNAFTSSNGPPAGHTGSPGDGGVTCNTSGCHTGMATTAVAGWITSNVPGTGYVPGQTYTLTATATQTGCVRFGFQISPQSITGTLLGTLIVTDVTNTLIVSSKYIEQRAAGTVGSTNSHTWTFNWIAPAAGTGSVTFYGAFNCSNNNGSSGGDAIFTSTLVIPQCNASTTVTANGPTTFCAGGSVTLNAGAGFQTYLWSNGATTQTITVTTAGTYNVTVTNAGGCQAVASSVPVVVNAAPSVPVITPNGSTTFCQGGIVNLTATGGLAGYLWSTGATTQTIIASSAGNYFVTVTNANGCTSTSSPTQVIVNALPTPSISGSSTICAGASSVLNAGAGYNSYLWSNGATTQTITVNTANTFSVTVTNANGCSGSSSIVTTIGNALTPTISTTGSTTICQGNSVSLDAGNGFSTYSWSNGSTTQTIIVNSAGNYSVNVTNANGCTGVSNTVVTTVADTPVTSASIFPNPVCSGETVNANASGDTTWIFEWNPGGVLGKSVTLTPATSTTYTLMATNSNNCSTSFEVSVAVLLLPAVPTITQAGGILTANSSVATAYQWLLNGTSINGATNSSYSAGAQTGNYTVVIADSMGCGNESAIFNYIGDGISTMEQVSIYVYPNPFVDFLSVENLKGENEIVLLNVEGEIVFKKTVTSENDLINTSELLPGFYLLKINSEKEISNRVVVKH